jgi:hypothetical protein
VAAHAKNITGQQFGKLIALRPTSKRSSQKAIIWECKCTACGVIVNISSIKLRALEIKSCGCQERVRASRSPKGHSGFNSALKGYKYHAKNRGHSFDLTDEEAKDLMLQNCTYCNAEPNNVSYGSLGSKRMHGKFIYNGIDRIDNSLGYTIDNTVPCCAICNRMKSSYTLDEFVNKITEIYNNFVTKD